jgi:glycosyltransferase involved in cell wall biosynthesis
MIKPTVTIGIPAFNEEANIAHILKALLKQDTSKYILEKIIVSSDASEDNTNAIVKSLKSPLIDLIENTKRDG